MEVKKLEKKRYSKNYLMDTLDLLSCKKKYNSYIAPKIDKIRKKEVYKLHLLLNDLWWNVAKRHPKSANTTIYNIYKSDKDEYTIKLYDHKSKFYKITLNTYYNTSGYIVISYYYYTIEYKLDEYYTRTLFDNIDSWYKSQKKEE